MGRWGRPTPTSYRAREPQPPTMTSSNRCIGLLPGNMGNMKTAGEDMEHAGHYIDDARPTSSESPKEEEWLCQDCVEEPEY